MNSETRAVTASQKGSPAPAWDRDASSLQGPASREAALSPPPHATITVVTAAVSIHLAAQAFCMFDSSVSANTPVLCRALPPRGDSPATGAKPTCAMSTLPRRTVRRARSIRRARPP